MAAPDAEFGRDSVSFEEAYTSIRRWYRDHSGGDPKTSTGVSARSRALVEALPDASEASALEMRAVFAEVIMGSLEWAYKKSDGRFRMGEYAHSALQGAGLTAEVSDPDEREQLSTSALWPYLFCPRYW